MAFKDVNAFRKARGRRLGKLLSRVRDRLGRALHIVDIGGRQSYWGNIDLSAVERITIMNFDATELADDATRDVSDGPAFEFGTGDARDLSDYADGSVDFVHSNSVIEHVGPWADMQAMAREVRRVGQAGWIQTPAYEFPIEPHFRAPFLHWFGQPTRRAMLSLSRDYRGASLEVRRWHVDRINLLSRPEIRSLFPEAQIYVERVLLAKSYSAYWGLGPGERL